MVLLDALASSAHHTAELEEQPCKDNYQDQNWKDENNKEQDVQYFFNFILGIV